MTTSNNFVAPLRVVRSTVRYREMPEFVVVDELPPNVHRQLLSTMGNHALDIDDASMTFPYNRAPGVRQFLQTMGVQVNVTRHAHAESEHTGIMVCLYPDRETASMFAVKDGESPDNMHVTLAYLGKGDQLPEGAFEKAITACQEAVATQEPLVGEVGGIGRWNAGEQDCVYASVDIPGSNEMRERICAALERAGTPARANHGWSAHMTIQYLPSDAVMKLNPVDPVKVSFGSVWVVSGDTERREIQFGQKVEAYNVMQRRRHQRHRDEDELNTILDNKRDGHLGDGNAEKIVRRTGLDPRKKDDARELRKRIPTSPSPTVTSDIDRQIAEALGWW